MTPRPLDVQIDSATGLLRLDRGISVESVPTGLERFGGAYELTHVPSELRIVQRGRRATHFEVVPAVPMTFDDYAEAVSRIVRVPHSGDS